MKTKVHMSANIDGMLRNFTRKKMNGLIQDENGRYMTDSEARQFLAEAKAKGWKKIPCGDCEGFDHFDKGCPGHPVIEEVHQLIDQIWVLQLPEGYVPSRIETLKDTPCIICSSPEVVNDSLFLPPGNWQYLFTTKGCSEEDAANVVEWFELAGQRGYCDYAFNDFRYPFKDPRESLQSLLRSKGCDVNKNWAIIQKQNT